MHAYKKIFFLTFRICLVLCTHCMLLVFLLHQEVDNYFLKQETIFSSFFSGKMNKNPYANCSFIEINIIYLRTLAFWVFRGYRTKKKTNNKPKYLIELVFLCCCIYSSINCFQILF